jgi:hypothetical protein
LYRPEGQASQLNDVELPWKLPAPQLSHDPDATPAYFPEGQLVQFVAPEVLTYDPALHISHTDVDVAPTTVEYVPLGQPWQVSNEVAPTADEYVPAIHFKQLVAVASPVV